MGKCRQTAVGLCYIGRWFLFRQIVTRGFVLYVQECFDEYVALFTCISLSVSREQDTYIDLHVPTEYVHRIHGDATKVTPDDPEVNKPTLHIFLTYYSCLFSYSQVLCSDTMKTWLGPLEAH
jgi:hypothetical protein